MQMVFVFLRLWIFIAVVQTAHYQGGSITWKPVDPYSNATFIDVIIYQSHAWTLSIFPCNQAIIDTLAWYNDNRVGSVQDPFIRCQTGSNPCGTYGFSMIRERTYCTDFNNAVQVSSGALIKKISLRRDANMIIGFDSAAWADVIRTNSGAFASAWRVVTRMDLTQKYPINSSPVTGSLPIMRVIEGRTAIIQIPTADWDLQDDLRCRWARASGPAGNECGDVCSNLPGANISSSDCIITWNAVRRPVDISAGRVTSSYIAAIMVEDFVNTASTVPMSSVPLQILIFTYQPASGACNLVPTVIGDRPNRACIGVPINVTLVERIVATVYCSGDTITEFVTISPLFMRKTAIARVPATTNQWFITLTWTPTDDQKGPQVFCAAPIDQNELTGPQHCVNFVVGYSAPNLITPTLVQGSASPIGTVFSNHSLFSIQATGGVYKPNRNGTYIQIFHSANSVTPAWETDCGYSPDCIYSGQTVLFMVRNASWIPGAHYYILFSSGAASGNVFCAPESAPITDSSFWRFNIWDPGFSSTTTTSTTPPTTGTITTRGLLTTTPIPNITTTGMAVTNATNAMNASLTTLITTTTTTSVTTTSFTTTTVTTTLSPVRVITPKEYEELCRQPLAITLVGSMVGVGAVHMLAMFTLFTKLEKMFNPHRLAARARQAQFLTKVTRR